MPKQNKTGGARVVHHRWMLTSEQEIEAIALAQICRTNKRIAASTGIKDSSVTYILGKSKRLEGYKKYHTYRSEWRDGTGNVVKQVENQVLPQLKESACERLPKLLTHPAPKVAPPTEGQ